MSVGHATAGVLPGLVDGATLALGGAVVGAGVAVREAVGGAVVAGADVAGRALDGDGEIRTVSGVQAAARTRVSRKSPARRR